MRNKIFSISLILFTSTIVVAGIATTKVAPKIEVAKDNTPYDGKRNFLGEDAHKYIGQTLYLKGISEMLREYGYQHFYSDYKNKITYKPIHSYGNDSKYKVLAEKEYEVLDVIKGAKADYDDDFIKSIYGTLYILKLKNKINNDIIYYKYGADTEASFPFVVMKFYETQKKLAIGQKFVIQDSYLMDRPDYITGKPITIITGQEWTCLDLTIDEKWFDLSLVVQNSLGENWLIPYRFTMGRYKDGGSAYTLDKVKYYNNKFGKSHFEVILHGKIILGMTKEEVLLSWYKPIKINEDISKGYKREQWVYSSQYLYFENDKLTYMQNR